MRAEDVAELVGTLEKRGVVIWIDGGWAIDALLGRQTRSHDDLDIVIEQHDLPVLEALLAARDYRPMPRDDTRAWNFVLGDNEGHVVDIHVIVVDAAGNGIYGPAVNGDAYPAACLAGRGSIGGHAVRCVSGEQLLDWRCALTPRAKDLHDVPLLCEALGKPVPAAFQSDQGRETP